MSAGNRTLLKSQNHTSNNKFLCYCFVPLFVMSVFTITRQPDLLDFYSVRQGYIVTKLDDIMTMPLKPFSMKIQELDHYYLLPSNSISPRGIMIFLHSCKRTGSTLFNLPEDRIIAYDALQKGLAVLAPTSRHRESGCWTQMDLSTIEDVVDNFIETHNLESLPRMGMGDSSGASFLFFVYKSLQLKSMAIYNSPQSYHPDDLEKGLGIPTVLLTMPADETLYTKVLMNYENLQSSNIPSQLYKVTPRPFTSEVCIARFPEMEQQDCDKLFSSINNELPHMLDRHSFVKGSLTTEQWESFFDKLQLDYESVKGHYLEDPSKPGHTWIHEAIREEIKSCQGFHALTSEHHDSILEFLMREAGIYKRRNKELEEIGGAKKKDAIITEETSPYESEHNNQDEEWYSSSTSSTDETTNE